MNSIESFKELKIQDNIEFVGQLDSDNKNCFLKHAQCLVMPSLLKILVW